MKRAQKKFERDPRKKIFLRAKPYGLVKARNCELQSSQFNYMHSSNKTTMPPIEVIANCELCVTGCICGHTDCESASGHTALHE